MFYLRLCSFFSKLDAYVGYRGRCRASVDRRMPRHLYLYLVKNEILLIAAREAAKGRRTGGNSSGQAAVFATGPVKGGESFACPTTGGCLQSGKKRVKFSPIHLPANTAD